MENVAKAAPDLLAYIPFAAGGSWARGKDREDTVKRAVSIFNSDWGSTFDIAGKPCSVYVYDVADYDQLRMGHDGVSVTETGAILKWDEVREVKLPAKRKRR